MILLCVVGVFPVVPDVLNVVVILELLEQLAHVLDIVLIFESGVARGNILDLCGEEGVALLLEILAYCGEIVGLCADIKNAVVGQEVDSSCLKLSLTPCFENMYETQPRCPLWPPNLSK